MEVEIVFEIMPVQEGWLARSPALCLAAAGESEDAAITRLCGIVAAHCSVLDREGWLADAMARVRVLLRHNGGKGVVVRSVPA
jgi:hypothetical protein